MASGQETDRVIMHLLRSISLPSRSWFFRHKIASLGKIANAKDVYQETTTIVAKWKPLPILQATH